MNTHPLLNEDGSTPESLSTRLSIQDSVLIQHERKQTLLSQPNKNWDKFYKMNQTKFYKDRHWIIREYPEIVECKNMIEVGCGVGNLLFPLSRELDGIFIHACDFSPTAIDLIKSNPEYHAERHNAFVHDVTVPFPIPDNSLDSASMIFLLSAIEPRLHSSVITNISSKLASGSLLIFRDYAFADEGMLRLKAGTKIEDQFYACADGTFRYYFTVEQIQNLFEGEFEVLENRYHTRNVVNRKTEKEFFRIFIQAKFRKMKLV